MNKKNKKTAPTTEKISKKDIQTLVKVTTHCKALLNGPLAKFTSKKTRKNLVDLTAEANKMIKAASGKTPAKKKKKTAPKRKTKVENTSETTQTA